MCMYRLCIFPGDRIYIRFDYLSLEANRFYSYYYYNHPYSSQNENTSQCDSWRLSIYDGMSAVNGTELGVYESNIFCFKYDRIIDFVQIVIEIV
jgi:hypothetical protein